MKIKSFSQLKKLIELYKTADDTKPIVVKTDDGPVTLPNANQSMTHKLLLEGFDQLEAQATMIDLGQVDRNNEEYGGIYPTSLMDEEPQHHRLDSFISLHFDGKREGSKIVWNLPEGKFELDPWTLTLSKSSTS